MYQSRIKVTKGGSDGKEQLPPLAKEGDMLVVRSLFAQADYPTPAVALTNCACACCPGPIFSGGPTATHRSAVRCGGCWPASWATPRADAAPGPQARARALGRRTAVLGAVFCPPAADAPFSISFAREDLAALTGTAKETAIRLLSESKDAGFIGTRGSQSTLLAPARLREIAAYCNQSGSQVGVHAFFTFGT